MNRIDALLDHIEEDCLDILQFIQGVEKEAFLNSKIIKKAVCMSLINIGELVKAMPREFCLEHGGVPWKKIAGLRDLAAHKYETLDMDAVWLVARNRIPELLDFIMNFRTETKQKI